MTPQTPQTAHSDEIKKQFNLPDNAVPLVITFLTPGDTAEEFKVGIFINENQNPQLIKNTLNAVNDILDKKTPNMQGSPGMGGPQVQRIPTLKDFIED